MKKYIKSAFKVNSCIDNLIKESQLSVTGDPNEALSHLLNLDNVKQKLWKSIASYIKHYNRIADETGIDDEATGPWATH